MAKSASGRLFVLICFAAALGLGAVTCVATDETQEASSGLALSQYKYSSKSQTGDLITYYGPYLLNNSGVIYKVLNDATYPLAAQKWCEDLGYLFSSYKPVTYSGVRVAIATSVSAEWWFYGWKNNATVLNQVVCKVKPPTPDAGVDAPPPPPDAAPDAPTPTPDAPAPTPDAPDPCYGCWDY